MQTRQPYLCHLIVGFLGTTIIIAMLGVVILAFQGKEVPTTLVGLPAAAIGSLSSFLVRIPDDRVRRERHQVDGHQRDHDDSGPAHS